MISGKPIKNFLRRLIPFLFDERDFVSYSEVKRYVFVKQNYILVYGQQTDPCPLYSIPISSYKVIEENPNKLDKDSVTISPRVNTNESKINLVTILLKDKVTGKQSYQFTFDTTNNKPVAKNFVDVLTQNSNERSHHAKVVNAQVVSIEDNVKSSSSSGGKTVTVTTTSESKKTMK